jgi:hypothetical protein
LILINSKIENFRNKALKEQKEQLIRDHIEGSIDLLVALQKRTKESEQNASSSSLPQDPSSASPPPPPPQDDDKENV